MSGQPFDARNVGQAIAEQSWSPLFGRANLLLILAIRAVAQQYGVSRQAITEAVRRYKAVRSYGGKGMRLTFCAACGSKDDLQHHHLVTRSEGDATTSTT